MSPAAEAGDCREGNAVACRPEQAQTNERGRGWSAVLQVRLWRGRLVSMQEDEDVQAFLS